MNVILACLLFSAGAALSAIIYNAYIKLREHAEEAAARKKRHDHYLLDRQIKDTIREEIWESRTFQYWLEGRVRTAIKNHEQRKEREADARRNQESV
ncbi:hypothetical protein SMA75_20115 [Escherichia coli]|uniref:hypothetical protein n=1 Tax=Escherichia coli TaxID=562 RepID=UPI00307AAE00